MKYSTPQGSSPGSARPLIDSAIATSPDASIPFHTFMQLALYAGSVGYYTKPETQITGRSGDFFTSVSVGRCFGFLLAHQVAECWSSLGSPTSFALVEAGANDGQLSADILAALAEIAPACASAALPILVEQSPPARQKAAQAVPTATVAETLPDDLPRHAVLIANELLDAFPVHLVQFAGGEWHELHITHTPDHQLVTTPKPITNPALAARTAELGTGFPEAYTTEINLLAPAWITHTAARFDRAHFLILDYGYPAHEYYAPHRQQGTLRTFAQHTAGENPLESPGDRDITAHIDFSALATAAKAAGLTASPLQDQHYYLTRLATPWLQSLEADPQKFASSKDLIRQFQTLTHPSMMGRQFKVLQLSK